MDKLRLQEWKSVDEITYANDGLLPGNFDPVTKRENIGFGAVEFEDGIVMDIYNCHGEIVILLSTEEDLGSGLVECVRQVVCTEIYSVEQEISGTLSFSTRWYMIA